MKRSSPSLLKATLAIVQKDLAAEFRSRELISAMLVFSLLVILIFNFGTGNALEGFAFALTFGVFAGTFSSIYIAAPVFVWLEERARRNAGSEVQALKAQPAASEETV